MEVRTAAQGDLAAIQAIYAHHVLRGLATFEEVPPDLEEVGRRHQDVTTRGLPYLVAAERGEILGYGYCAPYRARSAYRFALEDSIYIKEGHLGKGLGGRILGELLRTCEGLGYRQVIAVIGDSANLGSIALHARLGFLRVGTLRSSGYKFGRWVDTVLMQRALGPGDGAPPST